MIKSCSCLCLLNSLSSKSSFLPSKNFICTEKENTIMISSILSVNSRSKLQHQGIKLLTPLKKFHNIKQPQCDLLLYHRIGEFKRKMRNQYTCTETLIGKSDGKSNYHCTAYELKEITSFFGFCFVLNAPLGIHQGPPSPSKLCNSTSLTRSCNSNNLFLMNSFVFYSFLL